MHVSIAGGSGFVGSHLIQALVQSGISVRALVRDEQTSSKISGVSYVKGNIQTGEGLSGFFKDTEVFINLIGRFDPPLRAQLETNVVTLMELFESAGKAGVTRIIHISAAAVYGDRAINTLPAEKDNPNPTTGYALSKLLGEQALQYFAAAYSMQYTILRPTNIYGEDAKAGVIASMADSYRKSGSISITGDGKQTRDFVHVEDLISAIVAVLSGQHRELVYNVSSGEVLNLNELADIFRNAGDKKIRISHVPEAKGFVRALRADNRKLMHDYAWKPRYNVTDTVVKLLQYAA